MGNGLDKINALIATKVQLRTNLLPIPYSRVPHYPKATGFRFIQQALINQYFKLLRMKNGLKKIWCMTFARALMTVAVGLALIFQGKADLGQKQDTMKTDNKA